MQNRSIKRVSPFCICFYCICCDTRVDLRRGFHRHGCVTAHASRNSAHDGEGEGKRGLGMGFHRVNYTIFAAVCVGFRGRFPPPRKVSVVRREQIRVLSKNRTPASTSALRTTFGRGICVNCRVNCRGLSTFQLPRGLPRRPIQDARRGAIRPRPYIQGRKADRTGNGEAANRLKETKGGDSRIHETEALKMTLRSGATS